MTEPTREQLALAICAGLTDEQLKSGPKTAKLWESFNIAYYQVNLLAEAVEDVLMGTRYESVEARDGNGLIDLLSTGPTQNQLMLWASILRGALTQAAEIKPGDVPSDYKTGDELITAESEARESVNEGVPALPVPDSSEIH